MQLKFTESLQAATCLARDVCAEYSCEPWWNRRAIHKMNREEIRLQDATYLSTRVNGQFV